VPTIPAGSGTYVLSIIGGIGGSITMLSYNYWMREEKMSGPRALGYVRGDVAIGYVFTALVRHLDHADRRSGVLPARRHHHRRAGGAEDGRDAGTMLGRFGVVRLLDRLLGAVFASLLGVWQSVPYLYADFYGIVRKLPPAAREELTKVTSAPYRLALIFITLAPLPFAFIRGR
jgi:hypothetical protein